MTTVVSSILPWARYFVSKKLFPKNPEILEHTYEVKNNLNEKVSIWKGDITKLEVDAIVNAANSSLLGGGGVDGAIHRAAGEQLRDECATLNGCRVGEAKITKGYNLPAKHVIHTVGTLDQDPEELAKSYRNSLSLMLQHSLRTIAFPCISTGIFGYDPEQAAHVAIRETRQFLVENTEKVDRVIFCMYLESDLTIYEELMQRYFPVNHPPADYTLEDIENYIRNHPEEKVAYENILNTPATLILDWSQISSKV